MFMSLAKRVLFRLSAVVSALLLSLLWIDTSSAACIGKNGLPGSYYLSIESGDIERSYILHVPLSYDDENPTALVLNFHGVTSSAANQEDGSQFSEKADEEGFIVAYPEGYGASWNAGWCCSPANTDGIDDVQFSRDLVAAISEDYCIDPNRIFATGFSNGAFMSHRLGCEASDLFAAVAPASGVIAIDECLPERPVPVIQTHGTADTVVLYSMGFDSNEEWAAINECLDETSVVYRKGGAQCYVYDYCAQDATVEMCTVRGMGHTWPTSEGRPGWIDATDQFWDFFVAHPFPR